MKLTLQKLPLRLPDPWPWRMHLENSDPILLEPIMKVEVSTPG